MSASNLTSVLKSCSEGELENDEKTERPKQNDISLLKRTFTLPRNPFTSSSKTLLGKSKCNDSDGRLTNASGSTDTIEEVSLERKFFRRPSWKRFINRIAQHMNTVGISGVKSQPCLLNGDVIAGEPPWPPGMTPAATGLRNHGNTCYMNAVLQCLSHTDVIAEYLVLDHYKADLLKRNKLNSKKYGTKGEITEQLAAILKALWGCHYTPDMSVAFKSAVERHGTQYRGNSQHDAQEFLFWLLDKVHEDLNTATKKKYKTIKNTCGKPDEVVAAETLANHARRNSSFVQSVFQAQYRSALMCSKCSRRSCTFDPFHCVSVQLPSRVHPGVSAPLAVNVVYMNQQPRQVKIGVELNAEATMEDLRKTLSSDTGIPVEQIILAEVSSRGWHTPRASWEPAGADYGHLYCIEAPQLHTTPSTPYLLVLWINILHNEKFGAPYAMQVPRECSYVDLQKLMLKEMSGIVSESILTSEQPDSIFRARIAHLPSDVDVEDTFLQPELPHPLFAIGVERAVGGDGPPHVQLELIWEEEHRDNIVFEAGDACEVHVSCGRAELTLSLCLQHYTRAETLAHDDAWRCPQCERYMPVVKTLGLWSLPDVLVIHLKRFRQQAKGRGSTKLTTMVDFPLTDLDMTQHLVQRNGANGDASGHSSRSPWRRNSHATASPVTSENLYDLYAVCYHHGDDLETGHYTAACKNPYNGAWYKFDDAKVTKIDEEDPRTELINNTAYMLFYKRKKQQITQPYSNGLYHGHWALRMPKLVAKADPIEEAIADCNIEREENVTNCNSSDDNNVTNIEINGNDQDNISVYENNQEVESYTIHKDVHVNPKMTPVLDSTKEFVVRPKSVDYPHTAASKDKDMNRNYESSPFVASINRIEYENGVDSTEEIVLSMFRKDTEYLTRSARYDKHRNGPTDKTNVWKTRIST